jgi:NAD(P)-dependent dehydrogenase (short-subunit alcohol dehydrogenase family)
LCESALRESGHGSVINVSSIYGVVGPNYGLYEGTALGNPGAYAASKGGVIQLTRWLATTLAPNVRVNCISPGGIERGQNEQFQDRYTALTPLKRMGREEDLKGAVAFLASDLSQYVTGQNLMVDGGWTAW